MPAHPALTTADGTPISRFCFGTMQFGAKADAAESQAMYQACREADLNLFDTAWLYNEGESERLTGRFAAPEREKVFIATKAQPTYVDASFVADQFEESLDRLGTGYVDLLYLHQWDHVTPLEKSIEALAKVFETGRVRYLGVSNFAAWQVMKAQRLAHGFSMDISVLQPMYNLVKRQAEVEILPMAASEGFAVMPYSPLGGGLLTGKYAAGAQGRLAENDMYKARYGQEWMHRTAADLAALAAEIGVPAPTLAVAWVARNPAITAPIISARSVEQLRPSLDALTFEMDDALYARVSALSPKPAPANDRLEEA